MQQVFSTGNNMEILLTTTESLLEKKQSEDLLEFGSSVQ
jgi:hypothetical protein